MGRSRSDGRSTVGHPVDVATGIVTLEHCDINVPCRIALTWTRYYSTERVTDPSSPFGVGWRTEYSAALIRDIDGYRFIGPKGNHVSFNISADELERGKKIINYGAYCELFKRDDDYVVSQWDIGSSLIVRYVFRPLGEADNWHLYRIEDVTGQGVTLFYDSDLRLNKVVESRGERALDVKYDASNLVSQVFVVVGEGYMRRLARYEYDTSHQLRSAYDPADSAVTFQYDSQHRLVRETTRDGGVFSFSYDEHGRCFKTTGLDDYDAQHLIFRMAPRETAVTNSLGDTWIYRLRDDGKVSNVVSPLGFVKRFEYDDYGRIVKEQYGNGATTSYLFDQAGNRVQIVNPIGESEEFIYNDARRMVSYKDRAANIWLREYDDRNRLSSETDPGHGRWEYRYNVQGDLVSITNPLKDRKLFTFNERGDLIARTNWSEAARHYERDPEGRVIAYTDALDFRTAIERDVRGYPRKLILPDQSVWRLVYDAQGYLLHKIDPTGRRTTYRYGCCGRLQEIIFADGSKRQYVWSTIPRRLLKVINEIGETYEYQYDSDGRLSREIAFDGAELKFDHDAAGWCIAVTDADAHTTRFLRDPLGRIKEKKFYDGQSAAFTYDPLGYVLSAGNRDCTVRYERDFRGKVTRESINDQWVESRYDLLGNRVARRSSLGSDVSLFLGKDSSVDKMLIQKKNSVVFIRDRESQEVERHIDGALQWQQRYDYAGRLIAQRLRLEGAGVGNSILQRTFTYSPPGHLEEVKGTHWGKTRYAYNQRWCVQKALHDVGGNEFYIFDQAERIVQAEYSSRGPEEDRVSSIAQREAAERREYGPGGRLLSRNNTRYEYDHTGRTLRKIEYLGLAIQRIWSYGWRSDGLLGSVTLPTGETWKYSYDPFGRRLWKENSNKRTDFLWDEYVLAEEINRGHDVVSWIFEPRSFRPFAKVENGELLLCINDQVGVPRELMSAKGEIVWRCNRSVWGMDLTPSGGIEDTRRDIKCPIRFQGQWYDQETGLCYNRFRYYDPEIGAYNSPDPSGISGFPDLYNYPRDPLIYIDPYGLVPLDATGYSVYGLYHTDENGRAVGDPYYIGISNDTDRRSTEHVASGRLGDDSTLQVLPGEDSLTYQEARGREQAYIEHFETKPPDEKGEPPGNIINSFCHDRGDERGKAFEEEYKAKKAELDKQSSCSP